MDSERRLGAWMQLLVRKLNAGGNYLLKDKGITVMQLRILRYIRVHPEQTQITNISDFFDVRHTSTIQVIRALEEKGYIYREPIPHSHGKKIKLTQEGEMIAAQNENTIDQTEKIMFDGFSEEEKTFLFQLLGRINDNLDKGFQITKK
ncbi:MAG: MarR family transcriptional regulator [Subdoligranulum sp.]|nr:MarR family transcriptional regulator [Subdoligranulum sp.]